MHLTFSSDFNILCTVGFHKPVISASSSTMCLMSLLTLDSTFVKLQVFLSSGLMQDFLHESLNVFSILKPAIHSNDVSVA